MIIFSYPIKGASTTHQVPKGARFLCVKEIASKHQHVVYALVDPDQPTEARTFFQVQVEQVLPDFVTVSYIDTIVTDYGRAINHIFVEDLVSISGENENA